MPPNFHDSYRYHTSISSSYRSYVQGRGTRSNRGLCMGFVLAADWSLHGSHHGVLLHIPFRLRRPSVTLTRWPRSPPAVVHESEEYDGVDLAAQEAWARERERGDGQIAIGPTGHNYRHEHVHRWWEASRRTRNCTGRGSRFKASQWGERRRYWNCTA